MTVLLALFSSALNCLFCIELFILAALHITNWLAEPSLQMLTEKACWAGLCPPSIIFTLAMCCCSLPLLAAWLLSYCTSERTVAQGEADFSKVLFYSGSLKIFEGMRRGRILGYSLRANKSRRENLSWSRENQRRDKWIEGEIGDLHSAILFPLNKADKLNKAAHLPGFGRGKSTGYMHV